jgi:hypothetical protein
MIKTLIRPPAGRAIAAAAVLLFLMTITGPACSAQPWFVQPRTLYHSTCSGCSRYGDYLLSMGDLDRDGIPDLLFNLSYRTDQPPDYPMYYRTRIAFGKRPGTIDESRWRDVNGWGTLAMGDVNGDGLPDLLAQINVNNVSVMLGCRDCPLTIDTLPAWRMHSGTAYFGDHIAIGGLNDDGIDDIAVSSPYWYIPSIPGCGKVHIYFGGSKTPTIADIEATYPRYGFVFGLNGLWIGDVNGDGKKDLIVGVDYQNPDHGWDVDGFVDVYKGGSGFKIDPQHPDQRVGREIIPGPYKDYSMRYNLNILDVNNDGIQDLFLCEYTAGYVYYGGPAGFSRTPDRVLIPPDTNYHLFDYRAYRMGDVNGDGFGDYAVQAVEQSLGWFHLGILFIYLGGPRGMESYPVARAWNPGHGRTFADCVTYLGDMDGDGVGDFAAFFVTDDGSTSPGYVIFAGNRLWNRTEGVPPVLSDVRTITMYPNPFDDHAVIVIGDAAHGDVEVNVFDLLGREIRTLRVLPDASGEARAFWDGRDETGRAVPSGTYHFLVTTREGVVKGRVVRK